MATSAQIAANQQNAKLSTGPRTPQGIENSKHNATRHGLTGKQIVVPGEDAALYDSLRANLLQQYTPATETEAILVDEAAQNYWRLQRARRIEAQVIQKFGAASNASSTPMPLKPSSASPATSTPPSVAGVAPLRNSRRFRPNAPNKPPKPPRPKPSSPQQNGFVSHNRKPPALLPRQHPTPPPPPAPPRSEPSRHEAGKLSSASASY